ncbi:thr operon leader peptide [Nitrosopumilus cobalaminigenes]|uniref:Thr operon leader peptide n=1 Tax=Nitrosopumilus cobalaminigenes TaxID=1470066 RepID=A0A7D5R8G7_9ARCH|nr:thr operon leader peptide [Nitrosopumilus cobalaminigenes]QLH03281.1 thr operon leader peptide [Nitrosopumilus cobalaminigenes]
MNKHSIITIIAIIVIITPFAYSGLSIFGMQQLEYRWNNPGQFTFFTMSNHGDVELCNPMPFWISFENLQIITFYDTNQRGVFTINPTTINPLSSTVQEGTFSSEDLSASQHIFMTLDFEFDGGDIRLDPNKLIVVVQADIPILGIIPYSTTTQISGFDFDQEMNSLDLSCD